MWFSRKKFGTVVNLGYLYFFDSHITAPARGCVLWFSSLEAGQGTINIGINPRLQPPCISSLPFDDPTLSRTNTLQLMGKSWFGGKR